MMLTIPGLLSADDLARCRALLADAGWDDGRLTAGHLAAGVKSNQQLPPGAPAAREIGELILLRLGENPRFIAAALPLRVLPPRINRYAGGGAYGLHVDNALQRMPGGDYVRSDVSSTVFLNDPADYEGGELVIEDSYGAHRVKGAAGDLVLYPGTSLHRVEPVTRGERLAAFFWSQSFVASAQDRRTLFELDTAIQALGLDVPEHPSIGALTGVYHNLLRQWSTT